MPLPQKYFHDKFVLLLASSNVFVTFLCTVLIMLRVGVGQGSSDYIVQYRANLGIVSAFKSGDVLDIAAFALFAVLTSVVTVLLSLRTYHIHRALSIVILALGLLLVTTALVVSNSLLGLR
jgi:hypothetical protein